MSAFVTETLSEDLSVLIFSQSPVLSDLLATQLQNHGLRVTRKSSDAASLDLFLESGLSSTWYKVFWIDDVQHINLEKAKRMVKIFQSAKGLSYVVMHEPFTYVGLKKFDQIGKTLTEVNVFFEQRSPYTSLLTYQDILSNEFFSLNYQQIIHFLHSGKFPYIQDEYAFLSEDEMMEGVASLSFDPRGGKRRVVVSKKPWLARSALKAIQTEFRRRFKGEEVFIYTDLSLDFSKEFKTFPVHSQLETEQFVSELIVQARFHYTPEKEPEEFTSDIPKPHIPKPVFSQTQSQEEKREVTPERKTEPKPEPEPEQKTQPIHVKEDLKVVARSVSQPPITKTLDMDVLLRPLLKGAHLPSIKPNIQESSIQVRVSVPLASVPRAPVLIPEQPIPEIKRSKIILSQMSALEKPVVAEKSFSIPKLNQHVLDRVAHEKQVELKKETFAEESRAEVQKKQLEKKIAHMFSGSVQPRESRIKQSKHTTISPIQVLFGPNTRVGKWYRTKKKIVFFLTAVSVTTTLLVGSFFLNQYLLQKDLTYLVEQFISRSTVDEKTVGRVMLTQSMLDKQLSVYSSVLGTSIFADVYSQLDLSYKISSLEQHLSDIQRLHIEALRQMAGAKEGNPLETLTPSLTKTENVYKQLSVIEAELKQSDKNNFLLDHLTEQQQQDLISSLSEIRKQVLVGQQLTELSPVIFSDQKKVLALIVQDSTELRATGGFLQSVALLTFQSGQLTDFKLVKPDDVSASLSGVVTPPEEITQYLNEKQWFMRDSNWNPDFEVTAKQVGWFLDKGLGVQVDGVIGVNNISLAQLVGVFGSVELTEFENEQITSKNLNANLIAFAKSGLLENSQTGEKTDFLESVLKAVLQKTKKIDETQAKSLIDVLSEGLEQSEIQIALTNSTAESTLSTLGWTGALMNPPCPTQLAQDQCVVSSMYQVDSNVGVNKVNESVKKKVEHFVEIKPEMIVHKRVISYENSSSSNSWPGGSYKNYIRFYVPLDAKLKLISVNQTAVDANQIKQYQDENSRVFSTLIDVLPQSTTRVVIEYEEPSLQKQSSYAFFDQKQPGTGNTPTNITMFYDQSFVPTVIAPDAKVSDDKIEFSFVGDTHRFAGVKFR